MDKGHLEEFFRNYVNSFDITNPNIRLKLDHTCRVARNAESIAKNLNLSKEDTLLAFAIGILHDIARFKQITQTKTFKDTEQFDHGIEGVKLLFDDNLISKFKIYKKHYEIIKFAVKNHNQYQIEKTDDPQKLLHTKIVRDADKLDIFYIMSLGTSPKLDTKDTKSKTASPNIIAAIESFKQTEHKDKVTLLDNALSGLSMAYDFNYQYSKDYYVKNLNNSVINQYKKSLNKNDLKILEHYTKIQLEKLSAS
ncbi:MAG: HD domain-containing protein [Firmicutes bacterium]|nr:HD domain-containing protein [Bacillota bacterium]